jgi:hypothetical protein
MVMMLAKKKNKNVCIHGESWIVMAWLTWRLSKQLRYCPFVGDVWPRMGDMPVGVTDPSKDQNLAMKMTIVRMKMVELLLSTGFFFGFC